MHVFLFSSTHQCNSAGRERNDSSSHGEQYFEMQANRPSNSGDILLWNKKNEQQPVTFGEQLGCFASEKTWRKALVIRNKMTRPFQVWRLKFYSPLWYIFDHSRIPCGALGTHFPRCQAFIYSHRLPAWMGTRSQVHAYPCARGSRPFSLQNWTISRWN